MAYPEPGKRILKARMLTDHRMFALVCAARQTVGAISAKGAGVTHFEPGMSAKEILGRLYMKCLVAEACEHATCHCAPPAPHQKIGVSARRNLVPEGQPCPVSHVRLENMSCGDDRGLARPGSQHTRVGERLHPVAKTNLNTCGAGLGQKGAVERPFTRAPAQQVEKRSSPLDDIAVRGWIENSTTVKRMMVKISGDACGRKFIKNVQLAGPVLKPLKIVVKPVAHPIFPLVHNDLPTATRQHNRAG